MEHRNGPLPTMVKPPVVDDAPPTVYESFDAKQDHAEKRGRDRHHKRIDLSRRQAAREPEPQDTPEPQLAQRDGEGPGRRGGKRIGPREANILEVGAGEGDYSRAYEEKYAGRRDRYVASDVADSPGPRGDHGFLKIAEQQGVETRYGIDANRLEDTAREGSLKSVVATNPYGGGQYMPGVGFGLMKYTKAGTDTEKPERDVDDRFINSALKTLKPGGQIDMYGRSNALFKQFDETLAEDDPRRRLLKPIDEERRQKKKSKTENAKNDDSEESDDEAPERERLEQLRVTNPYLNISPGQLKGLAEKTKTHISVSSAKPPRVARIGGGAPDTPQRGGLGDYNTKFTITPSQDEDGSGVSYQYRDLRSTTLPERDKEPGPHMLKPPPSRHQSRSEARAEGNAQRDEYLDEAQGYDEDFDPQDDSEAEDQTDGSDSDSEGGEHEPRGPRPITLGDFWPGR
jgi:hypothetical protein